MSANPVSLMSDGCLPIQSVSLSDGCLSIQSVSCLMDVFVPCCQVAEQSTHLACCRFTVSLVGRFNVGLELVLNCPQTDGTFMYALCMHYVCIAYALRIHYVCITYALRMFYVCNRQNPVSLMSDGCLSIQSVSCLMDVCKSSQSH